MDGSELVYRSLHAANIARNKEWGEGQTLGLAFRGVELGGEIGEALNVIKKLERERIGIRGSRASQDDLIEELCDVVISAYLCAMEIGIDLDRAIPRKFNATSRKYDLSIFTAE